MPGWKVIFLAQSRGRVGVGEYRRVVGQRGRVVDGDVRDRRRVAVLRLAGAYGHLSAVAVVAVGTGQEVAVDRQVAMGADEALRRGVAADADLPLPVDVDVDAGLGTTEGGQGQQGVAGPGERGDEARRVVGRAGHQGRQRGPVRGPGGVVEGQRREAAEARGAAQVTAVPQLVDGDLGRRLRRGRLGRLLAQLHGGADVRAGQRHHRHDRHRDDRDEDEGENQGGAVLVAAGRRQALGEGHPAPVLGCHEVCLR